MLKESKEKIHLSLSLLAWNWRQTELYDVLVWVYVCVCLLPLGGKERSWVNSFSIKQKQEIYSNKYIHYEIKIVVDLEKK
jgi:hypothetical protein